MTAFPGAPARPSYSLPCLLAAALLAGPVAARPAPHARTQAVTAAPALPPATRGAASVELAAQINLVEGKSTLMHLPFAAARMAVGDAKVADVILINPNEVYLLGKATGSTNLILWNQAKQASIVDIAVAPDTGGLQQQLAQLFPQEKDIHLSAAGASLVLSGTVSDSVQAAQILSIAHAYLQPAAAKQGAAATPAGAAIPAAAGGAAADGGAKVVNMLAIAAPQQVMLEVKIAEVSKSLVDQLGASVGAAAVRGNWTYTILSNLLSGNSSKLDAFNKNGNFATIDAQKRDGLIKVLAEPTVMAISGQEASFLAGGKIFIPVAQNNQGNGTTITLEEKEFGIALKFTPTVLAGGRINLRVAPEVSELNREGVGITAAGLNATALLPSFTTRRASTTVQLFDGQSFAIGGLIKNNVTSNIKAFPLLGEVPVLGALFRSSEFQSDRTELVFIVTPHLARPLPPDPHLPTDDYVEPNRGDFFLRGKLEGLTAPARPPAAGFDVK